MWGARPICAPPTRSGRRVRRNMLDQIPVLELVQVTKAFGDFKALDSVSLRVEPGSVHGLCGENGAGKSTLIKILDGQYPRSSYSGDVLVDGHPVSQNSPDDAHRNGINVVPQETSVIDTLTVAENLFLGRWPGGRLVRRRALTSAARTFLDDIGIKLSPTALAGDLSASSKQLLMIARAVFAEPRVLLLDEPTTALTHGEVENLYRIVDELRAKGVTVLLISHKLEEIFHLCDHVSVLRDGEMVSSAPRSDWSRETLVKSMTGRDLAHLFPERGPVTIGSVALQARNISVADPRIPGRLAVDGLDIEVRSGEVVGVGGPLGAGRTELLLALMGGLRREGEVRVEGETLRPADPAAAARAGVVLVPEERKTEGLLFNLNIGQNVSLSSLRQIVRRGLISRKREDVRSQDAIERFQIAGASPRGAVSSLSGGNQQKVLLSRAVMTNPRVILLDEPTKGVDIGAKSEIYKVIAELAASGMAVLMVSSELPELLGNCNRILMMNRGRVVEEFDSSRTTREQLLQAAMSGSAAGGSEAIADRGRRDV